MKRRQKIKNSILIFVLGLVISFGKAFAEDADLEKIVVTSSRTDKNASDVSRKVDVIYSKDLQSSPGKNLGDALAKIPAIEIDNYGGLGASKTIKMRGSTASQVLVLVDGRPINSPRDGQVDLNTIPLDNVDRVEIMHGPGSNLYGSQAMGGVVNIITKDPLKEKQKTELSSSFGTFRTYTEQFSTIAKTSNLGCLVSGGYQSSEGFRDNSEFNAKDVNTKFEYSLNDYNSLILSSGFYKNRLGTPGFISSPDIDDKQTDEKNFVDLNWKFKSNDSKEISAKVYENYDHLRFIENTVDNSLATHITKVRGLDLQYSQQLTDFYQLVCGINHVTNLNDSSSSSKHKYIVRAGFLENIFDITEKLELNFGSRIDDYSNFGTEINPSAGFAYKFSKDTKFHGLISRSFRAPTFNDLYWPDEGWAKGNPDLSPEKGVTKELGFETKINKYFSPSITYYRNDFDSLINWAPADPADPYSIWQPTNIDSAVINGIELGNKLCLTDNLSFNSGYTFLSAKNKETHKYLIYQPRNKVDLSLSYYDYNGFSFKIIGQFTDERFADTGNTATVKRFFTVGMSMSKKIKSGITYYMNINNLLNRKYQMINDYPVPGFYLESGLKLEF